MGATTYAGIDYGRFGQSNRNTETGIHFGVINQNEVLQAWFDGSEADYGDPHCPDCGEEAVAGDAEFSDETKQAVMEWLLSTTGTDSVEAKERVDEQSREELGYERKKGACGDHACDACHTLFDGEDAFGDEPAGHYVDDGEYKATQYSGDGDIFVLQSPYYTRAQYCSPCAPGAGYLMNPCPAGPKSYCFGHDWFEGDKAPYPVYRVSTDKLVKPPGGPPILVVRTWRIIRD